MNKFISFLFLTIITIAISVAGFSQSESDKALMSDQTFAGLKLRSIGPAFMSGRIADIVIHPENENIWYVAVGSGGVWKTTNAGTTFKPVFDKQKVYSIGCITIDPSNPHVVWVGTGENIGGRHVSYGDGLYRSKDGGASWENMGLKESQHISKIIIHPENSKIMWVAVQGPLWNKGGERGLYKTTDGAKTWKKILGDDEWVGVTDIALDPRNPDWIYAVTWQRHRTVAAYMGGGPGTGIFRSGDGGENWDTLRSGLPKSNMGKIGLAISPQKPDVIYAAIELDRRTGGVFKSTDRGATWKKQSDAVAGATGPHYYQELYASPHQFDRLYLVDNRMQVSDDGGKTFRRMKANNKHGDNHALAFKKNNPDYLLNGTDGGVYESFDLAENWRFVSNLPVTQFYKLAVDDAEPFYNIYGGTQDNGTQGGPSRTDNQQGIRSDDWNILLFADGHQPATEPGNPDIMYVEWQEGNLMRLDLTTGEALFIKPQPEEGEKFERFNWDSPILVSPHSPTRLYFASQRVWRSDNRGDSWEAISDDLTKNEERVTLPIMEKQWSWDAPWDVSAMSNYNTITSLAESPKEEGLIYAGTDDGIIQVTEDGGANWKKIEVSTLPDVPATAFVNDIKADLYDASTVYVVLDNHKYGDLNPYILKSTNRGKSWKSIKSNMPDKTLVWRIVQDHVNPDLMFVGTEFGIYFTVDGGGKWIKLKGGVPTISFRDLAIQKRENDLVGASFGRSFYVFDDYSVLRDVSEDQLKKEASLFPTRDAWWYVEKMGKFSQGATYFVANNPSYGAVFTYYLKDGYKSDKALRQEKEKKLNKESKDIPFPGWDAIEGERFQEKPKVWLTVQDSDGNLVRRIDAPAGKGFHRVAWDLKYPAVWAIDIHDTKKSIRTPSGMMVMPGEYTVTLSKQIDGTVTQLSEPVKFNVVQLRKGALNGSTPEETIAFWKDVQKTQAAVQATSLTLRNAQRKVGGMQKAIVRATGDTGTLESQLLKVKQELQSIDLKLNGYKSKDEIGEKNDPTVRSRIRVAGASVNRSTYGPTQTHRRSLEIAKEEYSAIRKQVEAIVNQQIPALEKELAGAGAPWIEGQPLPDGGK